MNKSLLNGFQRILTSIKIEIPLRVTH